MERITIPALIESRKRRWNEHHDIEQDTEWVESVCEKITSEGSYELIQELKDNPEYLIELTFLIVDKEEETVPFFFNTVQKKFLVVFNETKHDFELGRTTSINFLILKGRQQGFTSLITALQLSYSMLHKNFTGMTIADNADNTHTIFEDKAKYPYNHLPESMKPTEKYNNRQELHFANLNARWRISTAGNKEVGRSKTIRFFHGCIHKDSLVLTSNNTTKKMEDVIIGDMVITSSGEYAPVTNKWDMGKKQTFEVKTWLSNETVKMTAEHKVLTLDGYKKCEELTTKDWIAVPKKEFENSIKYIEFQKPRTRSHIYPKRKIKLDYKFGFAIGYYLAEGHINKNLTRVEFASHKDETYIYTVHEVTKIFGKCKHLYNETNRARHIYDSREFAYILNEICGRTEEKHLPEWIYETNKEFAKGVIAGYFAGDGSKTSEKWSRTRATCVLESISRGMKLLICSVYNVVPSLHYYPDKNRYGIKTKPVWVLGVHGDVSEEIHSQIGVSTNNNRRKWINKYKYDNNNLYVKIKEISKAEEEHVYDIEVGHDDHNFLTPIGIVSNSEAAFWDSIRKVMTGLGQSLTKKSIKILESTANGFNEFKELWDEAEAGENNWKALFFEWWETPEYKLEFTSDFQKKEFIEKINSSSGGIYKTIKWLRGYANLSYEQLFWYYDKWLELKDLLQQEYPNTAEEAFIATGSQIFDTEKLHKRKAELKKAYEVSPPLKGVISFEYDEELQIILTDTIKFIETPMGNVTVYEKPIAGYPYVGAGDIAEGGVDFSAGVFLNNNTGNEACVLHGKFDTDVFAKQMFALGWWYNKALLAIEVNFDRHPTKELQRLKYPSMYYRESIDTITKEKQQKYGWFTSSASRPLLVDTLIILVRDNIEQINDIGLIDEMTVFVRDASGKPAAMVGKHDDLIMARGIAECMRSQQKVQVVEVKEPLKGIWHYQELIMNGWKPYEIKKALNEASDIMVETLDSKGKIIYTPRRTFEVIGMPLKGRVR